MRIGLVSEYFPPYAPGGAEWSALALANSLVARGHQVVVITLKFGDCLSLDVVDGIKIYRCWFPVKMNGSYPINRMAFANPLYHLYLGAQVTRIARQEKIELLHAQNDYSLPGAVLAAKLLSLPVVATVRDYLALCPIGICLHDSDVPTACDGPVDFLRCRTRMSRIYGQSKSRLKRLKRLVLFMLTDVPDTIMRRTILKKVDKVITVSDGVGEIFVRSGFRRNLIATVYNVPPGASSAPGDGSEVRQRYALGEKRVVLFAGKVSIGKGKDLLFDAIPCVVKQVPNVVFVLAGRWQSPEDLPESCRSSVRYLGVLPNHEVIALYECADVVVVPSVWPEPLSRVILEAMSAGCPVVATRVGGTPEMVIDGENGLLVFPHDPQELAQALVTVLSQRQLREDMGQRSRAILKERFSGEQSLLKLEAIYQKAVA